jgi:hypothetical protein
MKANSKMALALLAMLLCTLSMAAEITHQSGDIIVASTTLNSSLANSTHMGATGVNSNNVFLAFESTHPTEINLVITYTVTGTGGTPHSDTIHKTVHNNNSGFVNYPVQIKAPTVATTPTSWSFSITTTTDLGSGTRCDIECYYNTAIQ